MIPLSARRMIHDIVEDGRAWVRQAHAEELERWFTERTLETHCPYIYPPTSRYGPISGEDAYQEHGDWDSAPPALYIHIPYCLSRCNFCNFSLDVLGTASAPVNAYLDALAIEIRQLLARTGRDWLPVCSIYVGGGTPSVLTVHQLERLFALLRGAFRAEPGSEITVEVNPDTIRGHGRNKLAALRELGVTRISLGVQSFDDGVLRTLGRLHDANIAREAIESVRRAGIRHLNIDLMYELPGLTDELWAATLQTAANLQPDSISMYELRIAPSSPLTDVAHERARDPNLQRAIGLVALTASGYARSSPNQYLRSAEHVMQHYVDVRERLVDIIGLGVSAIACVGPMAFIAPKLLESYMRDVSGDGLAYAGRRMTLAERRTRAAILGFKSPNGVSLSVYEEHMEASIEEVFRSILQELFERQVVVRDGTHLRTTDVGGFFIDELSALFFLAEDVQAITRHEVKHLGVYWDTRQLPSASSYIGRRH
jgi:oxygen-independent coproporphyrinogen III oxidase